MLPQPSTRFGEELRKRRLDAGLSLTTLSGAVHYSKAQLSKVERGIKAPSRDLVRLCDAVLQADGALVALATRPITDTPLELARLTAACPEMTQLGSSIGNFARLLTPHLGNVDALAHWITQVRTADLPHLHAFTRGLDRDRDAVIAALTLPYSNGPTEGVNTKTKRIARQMHGRAGFTLLRHRILLG